MTDVEEFLASIGLSEHASAFIEQAIDLETLSALSDADLKEIGVHALGHRRKILKAAAGLAGSEHAQDQDARAQRRQLTLMFADLVGSTRLSRRMDLEAYRDLIRAYQEAAREAIDRHGGYVAKYLGDGVLAYFGYPRSHEDDPERAIRAGHALIAAVSARCGEGQALEVRIGVETGPVVVGDIIGEAASREHAVVGETPNLAARLQALAAANTIVVGPVARRLADAAATFRSMGEHMLKGFDAPVAVWRVDAIGETTDRLERGRRAGLSPLIGRRSELGSLASAFARMRAGESLCVHVIGEPGIGKSRLVHEFLRQITGSATILAGHCTAHGGSTAFFPFIDLMRRTYGDALVRDRATLHARLVADGLDRERHAPYLLKLLDVAGRDMAVDHDLIGVRTQEALIRLAIERGRDGPTILFINDLHWIDERSASVLEALVRACDRPGLLLVCTFRRRFEPPWRDHPGVENIRLERLSAAESLALFRSQGAAADHPALAEVVERAGGNPFFLEELARHLSENAAGDPDQSIPVTLAGLLMQRVDGVSKEARRHAETASVAGRVFEAALLGDATDTAVGAALAELEAGGLVLSDGRQPGVYRFRHALVQEVIYGSLLEGDRRRLHRQVGDRLRQRHAGREAEVAEDLARHFSAAGEARDAAGYAFMAGQKALDLFALHDASTWFGMCLALTPENPGAEDDLLVARAIVNQTQVLCWNGDFPAMVDLARRHLPKIRALGEMVEASRALTWIGEGYMHVGRLAEARAELERALELGHAVGDQVSVAYASGELLWLDTITGRRAQIETVPERCDALAASGARIGDNYIQTLACYARWAAATHRGEVGAALETARGLTAFGERTGYPPASCWGACMRADAEARAGNVDEAERAARAGSAAAACEFDRLMADLALGMTLATVGRCADGLELLARAPWRTDRIGALYFGYAGDVAYGRALADAGDVERGLDWLRGGIAYFERIDHQRAACMTALELARIAARQRTDRANGGVVGRGLRWLFGGRRDLDEEIRGWLGYVLANGEPLDMVGARAEAHLLLAGLDEHHHATTAHLEEARSLARQLGWLSLEQRISAERCRLEAAASRP